MSISFLKYGDFSLRVPNSFQKLIMGTGEWIWDLKVISLGRWEGNHTGELRVHFTLRGKGIRKIWMIGIFVREMQGESSTYFHSPSEIGNPARLPQL
jgi:hypothetical protein